jgi:hypothetical protein
MAYGKDNKRLTVSTRRGRAIGRHVMSDKRRGRGSIRCTCEIPVPGQYPPAPCATFHPAGPACVGLNGLSSGGLT